MIGQNKTVNVIIIKNNLLTEEKQHRSKIREVIPPSSHRKIYKYQHWELLAQRLFL
jgi:hypothetical protein